jgi:hypothetical protein
MRQRETSHTIRVLGWFESLLQDTAYGVRSMLRSKALTGVALLSLALGIGANTAIFSLLDAVLLRSLPVKDPQRLVLLGRAQGSGVTHGFTTTELYSYCRAGTVSKLGAADYGQYSLGDVSPEDLIGVGGSDGVSNLGRNAPRRPHPGTGAGI